MPNRYDGGNFQGKHHRETSKSANIPSNSQPLNETKSSQSGMGPRHSLNFQGNNNLGIQNPSGMPQNSKQIASNQSQGVLLPPGPQRNISIDKRASIPPNSNYPINQNHNYSNSYAHNSSGVGPAFTSNANIGNQNRIDTNANPIQLGSNSSSLTHNQPSNSANLPTSSKELPYELNEEGSQKDKSVASDTPAADISPAGISASSSSQPMQKNTVDPSLYPQQVERRNIFKENPNIYYFNGESLSRPLSVPPDIKKKRWIFIGLAIIIAAIMLFLYFDQVVNAPVRAQEEMQAILSQDISTNPPDLLKLLTKTDRRIKRSLNRAAKKGNYEILDLTTTANNATQMDLVKIPPGINAEEAQELYSLGLNNLDAIQLVTLLFGGWELDVDRTYGLNISLHYADFKTSSPTKAIAQAIAAEGFSRGTTEVNNDEDNFGNMYSSGSIMISNIDYEWTVSSTYLNEVYSANGLPDNATYVGIRIIRKAY